MSRDPEPLREHGEGPKAQVGRVFAILRRGDLWPAEQRTALYWSVRRRIAAAEAAAESRARAKSRKALLASCGGIAAAAAVAALLVLPGKAPSDAFAPPMGLGSEDALGHPWSYLVLAGIGELEVSSVEGIQVVERDDERQIHASASTVRARVLPQHPRRPVVVVTPHLRVVVVGTRFDLEIDPEATTVALLEGEVRLERQGVSLELTAGETVRSDDPRLNPPPVLARAERTEARRSSGLPRRTAARRPQPHVWDGEECEQAGTTLARRACLERVAGGEGFAAQSALYSLGVLARDREHRLEAALGHFQEYSRRFPDGVLAPEAALASFALLNELGRREQAVSVALDLEQRFKGDDRGVEAALIAARILCEDLNRPSEALQVIDRLVQGRGEAVQQAATRARLRCREAAGGFSRAEPDAWGPPRGPARLGERAAD